jgi:hypothetical protein
MKSFANTKLNAAWGGLLVPVVVVLERWGLLGKGVIWVRWLAIQNA